MMAIVAAFTLSTAALAQEANNQQQRRFDPKEMVAQQTDRMAQRYALTDEQTEKLLALNTEFAGKLRPMGPQGRGQRMQRPPRQNNNADAQTGATTPNREEMEARRKEMEANQQAYNAQLKEIFTEEQFEKYEADAKQMRERNQQRGGQGPRGGQPRQ